jgi:hypothetical protein
VFENLARSVEELRDDRLLWARADEVERVRVHAPSGETVLHRDGDHWRIDGAATQPDADAVDGWLTLLGGLSVEARLDASTAAAHGLAPPAWWIEVTRTGIEGAERIEIGEPDADRMYARRGGEAAVLGLDPGTAETIRADAARFRSRHVLRDVPDELTALVTDAPSFHDEATNAGGAWHLLRPFAADADAATVRLAASRLASLDAERWVALAPTSAYGLDAPRLRATARFEGTPPEPDAPSDAGADAAGTVPRVREYTLLIGAPARGGGAYAAIAGRDGVFVVPDGAFDDLAQPHVDHALLTLDRARVDRVEVTRPRSLGVPSRVVVSRDGDVWRTEAGAPADRARVEALLDRLADVRALRVIGYGPAPSDAAIGATTVELHEAAPPGDAGAARTVRFAFGAVSGVGDSAGYYARRDGLDATLTAPREVRDAVMDFVP